MNLPEFQNAVETHTWSKLSPSGVVLSGEAFQIRNITCINGMFDFRAYWKTNECFEIIFSSRRFHSIENLLVVVLKAIIERFYI
jgi:hypothetical protein